MNRCPIWNRLVFVLNLCLKAFKSYGLLFRVIREERKMIVCDMQLKTAYKSPCVSSMKLKRSIKDSLCYSESICVHFRPSKPISQELPPDLLRTAMIVTKVSLTCYAALNGLFLHNAGIIPKS